MKYEPPRSLDEIPELRIRREIERRAKLRSQGKCDYCGRVCGAEPVCKFPHRHRGSLRGISEQPS